MATFVRKPPEWNAAVLAEKTRKRAGECKSGIFCASGPLREEGLRSKSEQVWRYPFYVYECQMKRGGFWGDKWYKRRVYYVNRELILAITDLAGKIFINCYHDHLGEGRCQGQASTELETNRQLLRFRERLRDREGTSIRNLKKLSWDFDRPLKIE
jgi:hypothetical protein